MDLRDILRTLISEAVFNEERALDEAIAEIVEFIDSTGDKA